MFDNLYSAKGSGGGCKAILSGALFFFFFVTGWLAVLPVANARTVVTPWTSEQTFQNLVYGGSTTGDVHQIMRSMPDEVVKNSTMYPVIENHYYFESGGTGAATVFVFENGLLVGMLYKSSNNQLVDLTHFLPNNGDRVINQPMLGNYRGYYPNLPMFWW